MRGKIFLNKFYRLKNPREILNRSTRSKQIVLTGLLLVLTISIMLASPITINVKTKTTSSPNLPLQSKQTTTTKSNGNTEWNKTYGGSSLDEGRCIKQTSDGGYIIRGYINSFDDDEYNVLLIKTDGEGNHLWNKTY